MMLNNVDSSYDFDTYTVKQGDTIWYLAKSFNITENELMKLNGFTDKLIYPNQILIII